jgi:hypothetical protein
VYVERLSGFSIRRIAALPWYRIATMHVPGSVCCPCGRGQTARTRMEDGANRSRRSHSCTGDMPGRSSGARRIQARLTNGPGASGAASYDTRPRTSQTPRRWTSSFAARVVSMNVPPGSLGGWAEVRGRRDVRPSEDRWRSILVVFMRFRRRLVQCTELVKKTVFLNKLPPVGLRVDALLITSLSAPLPGGASTTLW